MIKDFDCVCCGPASGSSSSTKIFCDPKDQHNRCICNRCCNSSYMCDHSYSILKRICHKIIKNYNRNQCRENYTVFNGGNSTKFRQLLDNQKVDFDAYEQIRGPGMTFEYKKFLKERLPGDHDRKEFEKDFKRQYRGKELTKNWDYEVDEIDQFRRVKGRDGRKRAWDTDNYEEQPKKTKLELQGLHIPKVKDESKRSLRGNASKLIGKAKRLGGKDFEKIEDVTKKFENDNHHGGKEFAMAIEVSTKKDYLKRRGQEIKNEETDEKIKKSQDILENNLKKNIGEGLAKKVKVKGREKMNKNADFKTKIESGQDIVEPNSKRKVGKWEKEGDDVETYKPNKEKNKSQINVDYRKISKDTDVKKIKKSQDILKQNGKDSDDVETYKLNKEQDKSLQDKKNVSKGVKETSKKKEQNEIYDTKNNYVGDGRGESLNGKSDYKKSGSNRKKTKKSKGSKTVKNRGRLEGSSDSASRWGDSKIWRGGRSIGKRVCKGLSCLRGELYSGRYVCSCDVLRVKLEERDLSRRIPCCPHVNRTPLYSPFNHCAAYQCCLPWA